MRSFTQESIGALAGEIVARVRTGVFRGVTLSGNLGAGKTTLTQAIARELGVTEQVISPTFILMKRYHIPPHGDSSAFEELVHVDAYRLESPEECRALHLEQLPQSSFLVIEWPERCGTYVLPNMLPICLEYIDDTNRGIVGV
jgi:tRNA threonylcarbamoyladenosine biosynthesis protein TsaE